MDEEGFWRQLWRESLLALTAGWDLAIPIFAGVLAGYYLDRWLETSPTFTLGLLVLGIFLGYYNLMRLIRRVEQRSKRRKEAAEPETPAVQRNDHDATGTRRG